MTVSHTQTTTTDAPGPQAEPTTEDQAVVAGRVLRHAHHGGHVEDGSGRAAAARGESRPTEDLPTEDLAAAPAGLVGSDAAPVPTTAFTYMFGDLAAQFPAAHLPVDDPAGTAAALRQLGAAMVEDPAPVADPRQSAHNSTIPAVYTYWGQFLDHDLTLNTNQPSVLGDVTDDPLVPVTPDRVTAELRNLRHPALDLDSVYGDGPAFDPAAPTQAADQYDGVRLRVGTVAEVQRSRDGGTEPVPGEKIPPVDDLERDLPRADGLAQISDGRNDENLIVAQLHLAFLKFHNRVLEWVQENEPQYNTDAKRFRRARRLTRWHHQWLVVHDYLKTVTMPGSTDRVLLGDDHLYSPEEADEPTMPVEFSVAAYRFGHSQVRAAYDFNRNFGRPGVLADEASFFLLFAFTGQGAPRPFFGATDVLPFNWVIEWDRFLHKGDPVPDHFARPIDIQVAPALRDMSKEGNAPDLPPQARAILKSLATRNLLRGYLLALPTGQAVAAAVGVPALTAEELTRGNNAVVDDALRAGGFLERTPLWYYLLKEAEVQAAGNSLGEVGSRIVNETVLGQLRADPGSYLNVYGGWDPGDGVRLADGSLLTTIGDFLRFAGVR